MTTESDIMHSPLSPPPLRTAPPCLPRRTLAEPPHHNHGRVEMITANYPDTDEENEGEQAHNQSKLTRKGINTGNKIHGNSHPREHPVYGSQLQHPAQQTQRGLRTSSGRSLRRVPHLPPQANVSYTEEHSSDPAIDPKDIIIQELQQEVARLQQIINQQSQPQQRTLGQMYEQNRNIQANADSPTADAPLVHSPPLSAEPYDDSQPWSEDESMDDVMAVRTNSTGFSVRISEPDSIDRLSEHRRYGSDLSQMETDAVQSFNNEHGTNFGAGIGYARSAASLLKSTLPSVLVELGVHQEKVGKGKGKGKGKRKEVVDEEGKEGGKKRKFCGVPLGAGWNRRKVGERGE
jgi:hypothetical protein